MRKIPRVKCKACGAVRPQICLRSKAGCDSCVSKKARAAAKPHTLDWADIAAMARDKIAASRALEEMGGTAAQWVAYRAALKALPTEFNSPAEVVFPPLPSGN